MLCLPYEYGTGLSLGVECSSLYDVLAVQLLKAVTRADFISCCDGCATLFARRFHPKGDLIGQRRFYCQGCGHKTAVRAAKRAFDEDRRHARALFREGKAAQEIIAQFPRRQAETVRNWIRDFKEKEKLRG